MQFKLDKLSPQERMGALLSRQKPDRVPFMPFIFGFCARNVGYPIAAVYEDAEKGFWSQVWTQMQYDYDGGTLYGYASYGGWEFGGDIKMPRSQWEQAPVVTRFPAQTPEEVDALEVPDVETAGCYPILIEFTKLQQKFGMPVMPFIPGAFTGAGNVCEVNRLCRWMVKEPEVAHKLLRKVTDFANKVTDYFADTFAGYPMIPFVGDATSANQIISPKQFEEFVLPYMKETHEHILERGMRNIFCHICGEQNLNLPYWAQIPMGDPGIVSFGHEVDLETAGKYFPNDIIAGNIEPQAIQNKSGDEVYELCRVAIEKGKKCPGGYMLMAGCEVPVMSPPYNIWIMRKAINDFGWYD